MKLRLLLRRIEIKANDMIDILSKLTEEQKDDLAYELHQLHKKYLGKYQAKKNVTVEVVENIRLAEDNFLKVTFELDWISGINSTGNIKDIYQYPNKLAYLAEVAAEQNLN